MNNIVLGMKSCAQPTSSNLVELVEIGKLIHLKFRLRSVIRIRGKGERTLCFFSLFFSTSTTEIHDPGPLNLEKKSYGSRVETSKIINK